MKKLWLSLCIGLALTAVGVAQRAGMELFGFRVPDYNEDGTMKSQLFGGRAILKDNDVVEITDLKIEFYDVGKSNATVTAPHCNYDRQSRNAESPGTVKIDMQELTVSGRGFTCSGADYRFTILHDAKVVLKDVRLGLKDKE